jgi:hypothetical protein
MRAGRLIAVVLGALVAAIGLGVVAAGVTVVVSHAVLREDGFYLTPDQRFETRTAVLTADAEVGTGWRGDGTANALRVRATSTSQEPLFVGIGPSDEVEAWLAGTDHERVERVRYLPFRAYTERVTGPREVTPPGQEDFWVSSSAGSGTQAITWRSRPGDWSLVVMNADGRRGVAADVAVGVEDGFLLPAGIAGLVVGLLVLAAGLVIVLVALSGTRIGGTPEDRGPTAPALVPGDHRPYPLRVNARLDEPLSRWLWLVKWFLAIPHLFVLAFLWIAFALLTIVAGVMILVTGRYPRSIFDFNVGVLRWSWRVMYYAFRVLGTDRYPPFRLEPDPAYPTDLAVDYPLRLSRGLVLVKWWLLAIPHYLVVAVLVGAGFGWTGDDGGTGVAVRIGLIGLLAVIAVVILAFTGRYPPALFDLLMGLNRWVLRVVAYGALMRDEYPPFRLDSGGVDPGNRPASGEGTAGEGTAGEGTPGEGTPGGHHTS